VYEKPARATGARHEGRDRVRPSRCLVAVHVHVDRRHDVVGRIDGMVTPRLVDDGLAIRQVLPVRVRHGVHPSRNPTLRWPL
jgi:hypothetical protein